MYAGHLSASQIDHDFLRGRSLLLRQPAARMNIIRENPQPILHAIFLTVFSVQKEGVFENRYELTFLMSFISPIFKVGQHLYSKFPLM